MSDLTIIAALSDPALFGGLPAFRDLASWGAWLVFLKASYGLPLDESEQEVFRVHTGRLTYAPPVGGWREVVCVVGRQSGKTRIAALVAAYEAMTAPSEGDGTETYCALIAQDQRGALRSLFSYARATFDRVPLLAQSVAARRAETIALESGCTLAVYPCRPAAVRGIRARVVVCDELAFYRSSEGFPTDAEMLRAVRPTLATTGGKLMILSSPNAQAGALYELHRKHYGRDDASVLVWQASAPEMHPTLPADYLARMAQDDPEAYRSEVLGEFRSGISTCFDPEALAACIEPGVRERAPEADRAYVAFVDPSGGRHDAFTLGIAHLDGELAVLDGLRAWKPPFNPSGVIGEAADVLKAYHIDTVTGDRYGGEFPVEAFRACGISYLPSERDRSSIYLEVLPLVNAGRVRVLDLPDLLREWRGLERRRGSSGRDRVDHMPGATDDRVNSAAGALVLATQGAGGTDLDAEWGNYAGVGGGVARVNTPVASVPPSSKFTGGTHKPGTADGSGLARPSDAGFGGGKWNF